MLGTTHVAVGIAASLAILQPTTVTDIIGTIAGSALGGQISDIDCKDLSTDNSTIPDIVFATLPLVVALFLDYVFGNEIWHGVKRCVSENRQSQRWRWGNSASRGLKTFLPTRPGWQDGMHALA